MTTQAPGEERHIGLAGATGIGVGAIVGGGVLALSGAAFAAAGPAAILAFALNGVLALLTAFSFAEVASKFPQSGGTYVFAKKVFSIESAFLVGWVVWFASIAASVLYALGFGAFALMAVAEVWHAREGAAPAWLAGRPALVCAAAAAVGAYALLLVRKVSGGGHWVNVGKVLVFALLIGGGLLAMPNRPADELVHGLRPFLPMGMSGLFRAMGFTFIALQGFDLIASVGGEVRHPDRNIPRAMFASLGIALAIYIPLLLIVATVGMAPGASVARLSADNPEAIIAIAARNYLGQFGYWLVLCAGVLSMLSALQANIMAASHVALAMARDRSLPHLVGEVHPQRRTPVAATTLTAGIILAIIVILPGVGAAGAASSLIFLISFSLVHVVCILLRRRSRQQPPPFRSPLFPLIPVLGGLSCLGLAVFQGFAVPSAGLIVLVWMALGGSLFIGLFARRARIVDASLTAIDPEAVQLRGRSPLVLVPIANPNNAAGMVEVANALTPPRVGRVLLLTVVKTPAEGEWNEDFAALHHAQNVLHESLLAAAHSGVYPEALVTVAADPWREIARVASLHLCESMLLGLSSLAPDADETPLDYIMNNVDTDIAVLRAPANWRPADVRRILIPAGGRGGHDELLARLMGGIFRGGHRETAFLRVMPESATYRQIKAARRQLDTLARDLSLASAESIVQCSNTPAEIVAREADTRDLVILGVQRVNRRQKLFGRFTLEVARKTACPLIIISRRG